MALDTRIFKGVDVEENPKIIEGGRTPDCQNVRIENPLGSLNTEVGKTKINATGLGGPVTALHSLQKHLHSGSVRENTFSLIGIPSTGTPGVDFGSLFWQVSEEPVTISGFSWFSMDSGDTAGISNIIYDSNTSKFFGYRSTGGIAYVFSFDWDGANYQQYGSYGSGTGQFTDIRGIAYDHLTDEIYVLDVPLYGRLIKTTMTGGTWIELTNQASFNDLSGEFFFPSKLGYDPATQHAYVKDTRFGGQGIIKTKIDGTDWAVDLYPASEGTDIANSFVFDPVTKGYVYGIFQGTPKIYISPGHGTVGTGTTLTSLAGTFATYGYDFTTGDIYIARHFNPNGSTAMYKTDVAESFLESYGTTDQSWTSGNPTLTEGTIPIFNTVVAPKFVDPYLYVAASSRTVIRIHKDEFS
jgi:hypothetical protein